MFYSRSLRIFALLLPLLFIDCQKQTRLFKNIEVHGRLVNYFTKEPIPNIEIKLRADDVHSTSSYNQGRIVLDSYTTDSDGSFVLKSKASKKDNYELEIVGDQHLYAYSTVDTFFTAKPKTVYNIGTIYSGTHTYRYTARFHSTTGNCAWITDHGQNTIKINAGIDTTIIYDIPCSYFILKDHNFRLGFSYQTGPCQHQENATFRSQIFRVTNADTTRIDVNY